MGLIGDLQEAKQLWSQSSWLFRGMIIFTGFLAVSPIASLAEVVFEWKGFFLDALNIYKHWITVPIRENALGLGLNWNKYGFDCLFLYSLMGVGLIRLHRYKPITSIGTIPFAFGVFTLIAITGYLLSLFNTLLATWWLFIFLCFVYLISCLILYPFHKRALLVYCSPSLIAIATVLIFGAINAGLSR